MNRIEVQKATKRFQNKLVLNELDLSVQNGETLVIIGRSGCGKSVLLKHIIGLVRPDSGKILVDQSDVSSLSPKELNKLRMRFGMLFQGAALFDSMTVGENVGFGLIEHSEMSRKEIEDRVEESLNMVGLKGIQDRKPSELSGGMKKRVALARAICIKPEILLYDEPTTGLDPIMADAINDLIIELHDKMKMTSIVVTHDMTSAYKIASRIAMMYEGKIISVGTAEEIKNSQNLVVQQFINGRARGPITDLQVKV